jgi:hypothetical protein
MAPTKPISVSEEYSAAAGRCCCFNYKTSARPSSSYQENLHRFFVSLEGDAAKSFLQRVRRLLAQTV